MSLILLAGDDDLLLLREVDRQVADLQEDDPELSVDRYDASELDHLPELRTASLFGGRTCVVLRGVESVTGDLKAELEAYAAAPAEDAVLLLVARGTGRVQKLARLAKEHGRRVDVKRPADWDERGWDRLIGEEFRRLGRKADAGAIARLRAHAGTDPTTIASQVAAVCATSHDAATLGAAEVDDAVTGHGRSSGFAVADAIADRDPAAALAALRGSLNGGDAPLAILGAVTYRLRQLLQVRSGAGPKEAGLRPGRGYDQVQTRARAFNPGELAWCHDRLARLDVELKGSDLPDELLLELAVLEVATTREVGAPWNPLATQR